MANAVGPTAEGRSTPTESTPLSPPASQAPTDYHATQHTSSHEGADDSSHSDDSGSGYVSGSGRRESVFVGPSRNSHAAPPEGQHPGAALGSPRTGSLTWAFGSKTRDENRRTGSPSTYSPRMKPVPTDGAGPMPDGSEAAKAAGATMKRRSSQGLGSTGSASQLPKSAAGSEGRALDSGQDENSWAWFRSVADKYGAIELDNKGSVARDHLALERTFLAWLRTSLAFASIGIAITQLFRLNSTLRSDDPETPPGSAPLLRLRTVGKPLGTTFLGVAILILFIGWRRYFESQYWIIRGKFPASRGSVFIVTFVAAALIVVSLVVVVVVGQVT